MKNFNSFFVLPALLFCSHASLSGQAWSMIQKLGSSDQAVNDHFGISVAVSDSTILAGAWFEEGELHNNEAVNSAGAVYIYRLQPDGSWLETQKLVSPMREQLGYFGFYVDVDGDHALVGAFNEDHSGFGNAGRVYTYERETEGNWTIRDTLQAPDPGDGDYFGRNLAIAGDYALIGASNHDYDENGENFIDDAGAAYLYKRQENSRWMLVRKLVAPDRTAEDFFGKYLDLDEKGIVIGAFSKDFFPVPLEAGAVYGAYCDNACQLEDITSADLKKIVPADQDNFENFGWDVGISGPWIVVGKSSETDQPGGGSGSSTGAAYFFKWEEDQWVEKQKVYAPDFSTGALFGRSVGIDGPVCAIGAGGESEDEDGNNTVFGAGAVYVFELQSNEHWQAVQKLVGTNRGINDLFGEDAVDVQGYQIAVGAWQADDTPGGVINNGGAAYVFKRDSPITAQSEMIIDNAGIFIINNPAGDGLLRLSSSGFSNALTSASVSVFSLSGQLLYKQENRFGREWQVNLSALPPALYLVRIHCQGYLPTTLKWVKL